MELGMIASLIAIGSLAFGVMRFLLRPYREKKRLSKAIDTHFLQWHKHPWASGGRTVLKANDFVLLKKHGSLIDSLDEEKRGFLLRTAIQYGKEAGDWGYWLIRNVENRSIEIPLYSAIGAPDFRPRWRAAYMLELTFGREPGRFPASALDTPAEVEHTIADVHGIISTQGAEAYLRSGPFDEETRRKAIYVLEEIDIFKDYIDEYLGKIRERGVAGVPPPAVH
jgi:hypothetical protein